MMILVLKCYLNLGASESSAPWTHNKGLASGPRLFGHASASGSNIKSHRKFLHLSLCSQTANYFLCPVHRSCWFYEVNFLDCRILMLASLKILGINHCGWQSWASPFEIPCGRFCVPHGECEFLNTPTLFVIFRSDLLTQREFIF